MTDPPPVKFFKRAMAQVFSLSVSPRFGSLSRMVSTVHNARKATRVPEAGSFPVVFGFRSSLSGVHASRTLIAPDLATLLDAVPKNTVRDEYARLSIQENVLGKQTTSYGGDDRLLKAQYLQDKHKLILEGEAPYYIFVRWKPLEQQPIGWNLDLNDGVRLNIQPFITANVLRNRPSIQWGVDRGKNPPGSPWSEVRDNDRHLTLEEKRKTIKP